MPSLIPEALDRPGTHALIIGVSAYPHFGDGTAPTPQGESMEMGQLTGPARSASDIAAWLLDPNGFHNSQAPLASLRVLLSPGAGEATNPELAEYAAHIPQATREEVDAAFDALRVSSSHHRQNCIVVYIAGHGVQLSKYGAVVLLHDCGNHSAQMLRGAVDMVGTYHAFDHPHAAQKQFWFVDACRQRPEVASRFETLQPPPGYDVLPGRADGANLFLSAITGGPAYARQGGQTLFCEALLWALSGKAASTPRDQVSADWHVSSTSLMDGLPLRVKVLAEAENAEQTVDCVVRSTVALHEFAAPPSVDINLELQPAHAAAGWIGSIRNGQRQVIHDNLAQWPLQDTVEAGIYEVVVSQPQQLASRSGFYSAMPPAARWQIKVMP